MSERFKLVQLGNRGGMFYCKDTLTNERKSLHTKDRKEAEKLVFHKNEAVANVQVCRKVGMAYLGAADPELTTRTWEFVMEDITKDKHGPTLRRYETALKDEAYNLIKKRVLLETLPEHFQGGASSWNGEHECLFAQTAKPCARYGLVTCSCAP